MGSTPLKAYSLITFWNDEILMGDRYHHPVRYILLVTKQRPHLPQGRPKKVYSKRILTDFHQWAWISNLAQDASGMKQIPEHEQAQEYFLRYISTIQIASPIYIYTHDRNTK